MSNKTKNGRRLREAFLTIETKPNSFSKKCEVKIVLVWYKYEQQTIV